MGSGSAQSDRGISGAQPAEGGGTSATPAPGLAGGTGSPSPNPSASPSTPATGTPSPGTGPSITLVHTPQSGAPVAASAVVNGACAGTVYRAEPQAVAAASPAGASN